MPAADLATDKDAHNSDPASESCSSPRSGSLTDGREVTHDSGEEPACWCRRHKSAGSVPGQEDPLEKGMATHSSVLAWRIPGTEEPGGLRSMGLHRVGHD